LKIAIEKKEVSLDLVWHDPDFEDLQDDPRFKDVVGERDG
jgi:hypothetical protein